MTIYQYRTVFTTASGTTSAKTLDIRGGLCRQVFITANSSNTIFMANLQDEKNLRILDWGTHTGTLNDIRLAVPLQGKYTMAVTNASPDDTFTVLIGVEE